MTFRTTPHHTPKKLQVMKDLASEGITMVVVTQGMCFANDGANEVIFMDQGKIIERSKPRDMFTHPKEERTRQFLNLIQS